MPRLLPLVGVAAIGVLALKVASGADSLPEVFSFAAAHAEEAQGKKPEAPAVAPDAAIKAAAKPPAPVCAPTAAELAKEAGLSPAELRVLQSLGERRGELDKREQDLELQLQLMAAAEAKLEAKVKQLNALKGDINELIGKADAQSEAEANRLVTVFSSMKAKDAAARLTVLDDEVRLPIAARMKERTLAGILAQMPPQEAKKLTESLARRTSDSEAVAQGRAAVAPAQAAANATPAPPAPKKG